MQEHLGQKQEVAFLARTRFRVSPTGITHHASQSDCSSNRAPSPCARGTTRDGFCAL